jgi:hypothetical protein
MPDEPEPRDGAGAADEALDIRALTIRTLPGRMSVFGRDPLAPVLTQKPDLVTALARLAARLEG